MPSSLSSYLPLTGKDQPGMTRLDLSELSLKPAIYRTSKSSILIKEARLEKAQKLIPLKESVNALSEGGLDFRGSVSSGGASSPRLCAPACRPAHRLGWLLAQPLAPLDIASPGSAQLLAVG